jgi:hypothetical protein
MPLFLAIMVLNHVDRTNLAYACKCNPFQTRSAHDHQLCRPFGCPAVAPTAACLAALMQNPNPSRCVAAQAARADPL